MVMVLKRCRLDLLDVWFDRFCSRWDNTVVCLGLYVWLLGNTLVVAWNSPVVVVDNPWILFFPWREPRFCGPEPPFIPHIPAVMVLVCSSFALVYWFEHGIVLGRRGRKSNYVVIRVHI